MKNSYCYNLKLPIEFSTTFDGDHSIFHTAFDIDLINSEFKDWLAKHDLYIVGSCERFLLDPDNRSSLLIHIDNVDAEHHVKINYVFCEAPHTSIWYELKPGKELNFSKTSIGTTYAWAEEDDCDPVFSTTVGQPSLINAKILHGVPPVTSKRITFSMTLASVSSGDLISWADAERIFKDYIY